jgi:hypothetical protein
MMPATSQQQQQPCAAYGMRILGEGMFTNKEMTHHVHATKVVVAR